MTRPFLLIRLIASWLTRPAIAAGAAPMLFGALVDRGIGAEAAHDQ